jgi:type IV pilus assembly protein PilY1
VLLLTALPLGLQSVADDTEIYKSAVSASELGRPKVLIIFDDSGSMRTEVIATPPPFDSTKAYDPVDGVNLALDRIYWSRNGEPPDPASGRYFLAAASRCNQAVEPLNSQGFFQTKARRWRSSRNRWVDLAPGVNDPPHVECEADVIEGDDNNPGYSNGFAVRGSSGPFVAGDAGVSNARWGSTPYTFYSANYMRWYYQEVVLEENRTRLEIAQEVVSSLVDANRSIDFGLALFNRNAGSSEDGGRVVFPIIEDMDLGTRSNLVDMVNSPKVVADGWTPLCESTYEAYRYLTGQSVLYGKQASWDDAPPRSLAAEEPVGTYKSPNADCAYTYIILMTDGLPTRDGDANAAIRALTGKDCNLYPTDGAGLTQNCLPRLTEYMANNDLDGDSTNGRQLGITYTIGFTTDQSLLSDAANAGKGEYYTANNAAELTAAFQGAILNILSTEATFTSPAVAVDTFSQTRSDENVFFAMFNPSERQDWAGNIKKLQISVSGGSALLVDKNGNPAIDSGSGAINETASTFWSSNDGGDVTRGGVGGLLAARDLVARPRTLFTNTGTGGALETFAAENFEPADFGLEADDFEGLYALFGVPGEAGFKDLLAWAEGFDVDDEDEDSDRDETRSWILADMLHGKPLVINYGARGSFTRENPELRMLAGTNGGFLHMFGVDDGEEDWAFFPKELAGVLSPRRRDDVSPDQIYGIDGSAILYRLDNNRDGTIDSGEGDLAWVFFGLRRGGRILYALDVSNPDNPALLWTIDESTPGFEELGQTWSAPVIARIPGYKTAGGAGGADVYRPVLVFGAGYDDIKDDIETAASPSADTMGRGVYLVDAETGNLVWSLTPAADSATNKQETGLLHSVPAAVTQLDSNGDTLTDRLYFADTGGNLWRVDMPGDTLPGAAQTRWRVTKMAAFNTAADDALATDRRFFNAPDVVRTVINGSMVDAVLIGSGDRTNPNAMDVENRFYVVLDEAVLPYTNDKSCDPPEPFRDFRCYLPLSDDDLFDVTSNVLQTGTAAEIEAASEALVAARGWRLDLQNTGEKNLSRALTIDGRIYFSTFSPDVVDFDACVPVPGIGRLYVVNLLNGVAVRSLDEDSDFERFVSIGGLIPDAPSPHFGSDGVIRLLLPPGGSVEATIGNPMETGSTLDSPYGQYWFRED